MTKLLKKCLVTGGAGFIGSHLVERLLKEGSQVIVIDNLSEGSWENLPTHPNLIKHQGSILDDLSKQVAGQDVIFHLAALPRVQRSIKYPQETHQVNVNGTLNLLLAARDQGVKKFIFSSSSSVYGDQNHLPLTEDMRPNPMSPYALQKLVGEKYCQLFSRLWGLQTVCLRYFSVYGPRMCADGDNATLLPKFIKLIAHDKIPTINGSGRHKRDFTYVSDVVEANILAAKSTLTGEVLNIGRGENFSVNECLAVINKLIGKNIQAIHGPAVIEPQDTLANYSKAKKMLNWRPKVSFEEGLKTVL